MKSIASGNQQRMSVMQSSLTPMYRFWKLALAGGGSMRETLSSALIPSERSRVSRDACNALPRNNQGRIACGSP